MNMSLHTLSLDGMLVHFKVTLIFCWVFYTWLERDNVGQLIFCSLSQLYREVSSNIILLSCL